MLAIDGEGDEYSIIEHPVETKVAAIIPQASQLVKEVTSGLCTLSDAGKAKAMPEGKVGGGVGGRVVVDE